LKKYSSLLKIVGEYEDFYYDYLFSLNNCKQGLPGWYDLLYEDAYNKYSEYKNRLSFDYKQNSIDKLGLLFYYDKVNKQIYINEKGSASYSNSQTIDDFYNYGGKIYYDNKNISLDYKISGEYGVEEAVSDNFGGKKIRETASLYSGLKKIFIFNDKFSTELAFDNRIESFISSKKYDDFYSFSTIFLSNIYNYKINTKLKYEKSYMLPDFNSLFWVDNAFFSGNPDLNPEKSNIFEGGINLSHSKFKEYNFGFEVYEKNMSDLIIWEKSNRGKWMPKNIRGGYIFGTESSFEYDNEKFLSLRANYSSLKSISRTDKESTNGKEIIYRPKDKAMITTKFYYNNYELSFDCDYTGKMFLNETNSIDIDPFWIYSSRFSYRYIHNNKVKINLFIRGENLFDKQYQVVYGYPMPGRKIEAGFVIN